MGQGGAKSRMGGVNSKASQAQPNVPSSLSLRQKKRALLVQTVTPAYVLKNKILQHESYSSSSHDSNDIKNLI